jgi:hypothetical protein
MKKLLMVGLAVSSLFLTACPRIEIKNGEIPSQHMVEAQKLAGQYYGEFDRKEGVIEVSYVGSKPILKFLDKNNQSLSKDLLYEGCNSSINQIKSIDVQKLNTHNPDGSEQYRLKGAEFAFYPGHCPNEVIGRAVYLNFSKDYKVISLSLLDHYDEHCRWDPPTPLPGGGVGGGGQHCEYYPVYREGRFVKSN